MKDKVKISILLLFVTILSALNLKNGLVFHTTDNTERDAAFSAPSEINETIEKKKSPVITANVPKKTVKTASSTRTPKHYDFTGASYIQKPTGSCPDRDSNGKCTLSVPNSGIAVWHIDRNSKPFLYGHNYSTFKILASMRSGDTFSVRVDGGVKTYRVVKNFTLDNKTANANRNSIYRSTYGGSYDITLQTCVGNSNATVRYIQAVAV